MNENYLIFKNWLDICLKKSPINGEIKGINFGLFESPEKGIVLYISGSESFDVNDNDWVCNPKYFPENRCCDELPIINDIFRSDDDIFDRIDEIYDVVCEFVIKYVDENNSDLNNKRITVGFDDGYMRIII